MPRFEDRLFSELVEHHGSLLTSPPLAAPAAAVPARQRRPRRRTVAALAAAAAALAAVLVLVLAGVRPGAGPAAYAVVRNPDGTVTVTIREIVGVTGASAKLESLGVPARVVGVRPGCDVRGFTPARLSPERSQGIAQVVGGPGRYSVVLDPAAIPAGDTVLIAAEQQRAGNGGVSAIALNVGEFRGAAPECLAPFVH